MSRGFGFQANDLVARSLKITRTTHLTIASVVAGTALNASIAIQLLGAAGQAVLVAAMFVSISLGSAAVCRDLFSRSSQTVENLRSIGATSKSISYAVIASVVGYGAVGALAGGLVGTGVGAALGGTAGSTEGFVIEVVGVIAAASIATAAGVYAGAKTWRS